MKLVFRHGGGGGASVDNGTMGGKGVGGIGGVVSLLF